MRKYWSLEIFTLIIGSADYLILNVLDVYTDNFDGSLFRLVIARGYFHFDILYVVGLVRYIKNAIKNKILNSDK